MPRKQAFSGKQKKKQLQERREKKKGTGGAYDDDLVQDVSEGSGQGHAEVLHVHEQPVSGKDFDPNRYRLHFLKISQEEMKRRRAQAGQPVIKSTEKDLEMCTESIYPPEKGLDFPKRPPWDFRLSKAQLEKQEQDYYSSYVQTLLTTGDPQQLSYFELNLETWRQLWRVIEISDILLLIADIRYPALHLPPSLYKYLHEELGREVVMVLNKVDLAPPGLVAAWRSQLSSLYPGATILCFSSFPNTPPLEDGLGLHGKQKKKPGKPMGPQELLDVCKELVKDKVNLDSWQHRLDSRDTSTSAPELHDDCHHGETGGGDKAASDGSNQWNTAATLDHSSHFAGIYQRFRDGVLTIGCIGYPNVGKSSLLNGLVGKKVVSVSRTPGHTKHLQTIYLTPTVRLCDCPGLVFPSCVPRALQVVSGIFPIAQVREPYSTVAYLASHLDLPSLLHLTHPSLMTGRTPSSGGAHCSPRKDLKWSSFDICESFAMKCGYFTAKASRPDMYRAANQILRMAVEGRLRLCFAPPGFFLSQEKWQSDEFAVRLREQLDSHAQTESQLAQAEENLSSESDSEAEESPGDGDDNDSDDTGEEEKEDEAGCVHHNPFALLSDD